MINRHRPLNVVKYGTDLFYNKSKCSPISGDIVAYRKSASELQFRVILFIRGDSYEYKEVGRQSYRLGELKLGRTVNFHFLKGRAYTETLTKISKANQ